MEYVFVVKFIEKHYRTINQARDRSIGRIVDEFLRLIIPDHPTRIVAEELQRDKNRRDQTRVHEYLRGRNGDIEFLLVTDTTDDHFLVLYSRLLRLLFRDSILVHSPGDRRRTDGPHTKKKYM